LHASYESVVSAEGMYLQTASGQRILDAVGGAGTVVLGHGVREITDAIARHGNEVGFVYGATFTNPWQEQLAAALVAMNPQLAARVYFTSGGSEGNETALKMARQYHLQCGRPGRHKVIARWQSFHGSTLATLSLSGRPSWREPFLPQLTAVPHIVPPYCYRCPLGHSYPGCGVACADDLERMIVMEGPDSVAAFIAEPVIGSTVTGVVPVPEYYQRIREICDRYEVLFIVDEVLTGYGRTGRWLAIEHWGTEPDIVVMGKGISSGYVPLGAVLAAPRVVDAFTAGTGIFSHGFTYSGNPLCTFVGLQVLRYAQVSGLFEEVAAKGEKLRAVLGQLAAGHKIIGDVRGLGLFAGVEIVADRASREPFPEKAGLTQRIVQGTLARGVLILPGVAGANYGRGGDHIHLSPPYIITPAEIDLVAEALDGTLTEIGASL
ncbi:MAG TPA: aminotransferase class III-fold pyridoxal phosphate-dependent enzyme, partial [Streptosporangiaceae bacterium]|nr:aminotransferase class III-fold pyridoxal phosphate-dependent enzyme [Streptosporangiaceae bacterium]